MVFCIQPMREQKNCGYKKSRDQEDSAKNSKVPTVDIKITHGYLVRLRLLHKCAGSTVHWVG